MRLCWLLLLASLMGCATQERSARDFESLRDAPAAALIARRTPESLPSASLLLNFKRGAEAVTLITRAATVADTVIYGGVKAAPNARG